MYIHPEGPYIQPLGNSAPKYHTIPGIMGPSSLMVVYLDPLGCIYIYIWGSDLRSKAYSLGCRV